MHPRVEDADSRANHRCPSTKAMSRVGVHSQVDQIEQFQVPRKILHFGV